MGIPLNSLSEGCCKELNTLQTIDFDKYKKNKSSSSVDKVLECNHKYILIEEKSFLLDYFRLAAKECNIKFAPINGFIEDTFLAKIRELERDVKEKIMYKSFSEKTLSSADKIKDTVISLCLDENFCNEKVQKSEIIYLYCKSSHSHIDKLLNIVFNSKKAQQKIIECEKLNRYLEIKKCWK